MCGGLFVVYLFVGWLVGYWFCFYSLDDRENLASRIPDRARGRPCKGNNENSGVGEGERRKARIMASKKKKGQEMMHCLADMQ